MQKIELSVKEKTCHSSDDVQKIVLNIRASEHQKQLQKLDDNYDDRGKSKKSSEAAQYRAKTIIRMGLLPLLISLPFGDRAAGEVHVFVEGAHAVDYAVVGDLDYAVCDRLRELVVVA